MLSVDFQADIIVSKVFDLVTDLLEISLLQTLIKIKTSHRRIISLNL